MPTAHGVRTVVRTRRWLIIFLAAFVFAVAVAGWKGWMLWQLGQVESDTTISVGESITVDGSRYRVDQFDARDEFEHREPDEAPVRAPEGTKIILVTLTTEIIDESVDPETHYCFAELVDDRGRRWGTESEVTYSIKRPEAVGCSGSLDENIKPHQPLQVGFSYLVPAEVAGRVALELSLPPKDDYLITVVR